MSASSRQVCRLLLVAALVWVPRATVAASFVQVPATFDGFPIEIGGMSGDGQVLVGSSISFSSPRAGIRWTQATGWQDLGPPSGTDAARVVAASFDGAEAAGSTGNTFRWVQGTGWQGPLSSGRAGAISSAGTAVAGAFDTFVLPEGFVTQLQVWREGIGTTSQIAAVGKNWSFTVTGMKGDGTEVVGNRLFILGHSIPMRFAVSGGGVELPVVPEDTSDECAIQTEDFCRAHVLSVSDDGTTLVGSVELSVPGPPRAACRTSGTTSKVSASTSPAGRSPPPSRSRTTPP